MPGTENHIQTCVQNNRRSWNRRSRILLLLCIGISALAFATCKPSPLKELGRVPDFALQNTDGRTVDWQSFRGQPVLVFFGYTYCPDFCPITLRKVEKAYLEAGKPEDWPELIFISVDPERDTAAALNDYMEKFDIPAVALTGSEKELREAAKQFGVTFYADPENSELIQHSPTMFVIDESGHIRYLFKFSESTEDLVEIVDAL